MKFLVTGSTGLIGNCLVNLFSKTNHTIYSGFHAHKPDSGIPVNLDLLDSQSIHKAVKATLPDVIIHLAANTNVDLCETERSLANKLNHQATEILSKTTKDKKIFFVYMSTDYVFDGSKGMLTENDLPNPTTYYGKTKLEGENSIKTNCDKWCIIRTSTPYGVHPRKKSFPVWVIENIMSQKTINVVDDQYTSPVYVPNLCKMLIEISEQQIEGLYHVSGSSKISRYAHAELITEKLSLDKKYLKPVHMNQMIWKTKRPKDTSFDISKIKSILKTKPMTIQRGTECLIDDLKSTGTVKL